MLQREHDDALTTVYGDGTPTSRQIVRMLRPESPTFMRKYRPQFSPQCPNLPSIGPIFTEYLPLRVVNGPIVDILWCFVVAELPENCAAFPGGGFGSVAEQLYGPEIFCAYAEANRYVGDTSWHPDYSLNYNAPGCRFAFYLDPLTADSGALRIIPGSHAPPLHVTLHDAHQKRGGPGHTTEGLAAELVSTQAICPCLAPIKLRYAITTSINWTF